MSVEKPKRIQLFLGVLVLSLIFSFFPVSAQEGDSNPPLLDRDQMCEEDPSLRATDALNIMRMAGISIQYSLSQLVPGGEGYAWVTPRYRAPIGQGGRSNVQEDGETLTDKFNTFSANLACMARDIALATIDNQRTENEVSSIIVQFYQASGNKIEVRARIESKKNISTYEITYYGSGPTVDVVMHIVVKNTEGVWEALEFLIQDPQNSDFLVNVLRDPNYNKDTMYGPEGFQVSESAVISGLSDPKPPDVPQRA